MRTLVHLSDLHTGRVDPRVVDALIRTINGIEPDLIVFSGDLTQRATRTQFREAREFLDALQAPLLVIPGNHDVPLWNIARRFITPLERYKRFITTDLAPVIEDDEMIVVGVNTARSVTWGEGRINKRQVDALLRRLEAAPRDVTRIIVTHHPFDLPPGVHRRRLLGRARMAMARFAAAGADLFLSGHLHLSHVSHSAERYRIAGHSALIVQAGTVSMRGRGEEPSFNILRLERRRLTLDRFVWDPLASAFSEVAAGEYEHAEDGWRAAKGDRHLFHVDTEGKGACPL
jgi:3',5'-cyclic AMP phosphodiesterase CpdA